MSENATPKPVSIDQPSIRPINVLWSLIALAVTAIVIAIHNFRLIDFVHVFAGLLWTGTDLFMGFILGPIMRRLDVQSRRNLIMRLMPKMIFYMPTLAIITPTAGFYLASMLGYLNVSFPQYWWMISVYVILAILAIQGLGILLPINLRVYFELRKEQPNIEKIQRLMKNYVRTVAIQATMQVTIIFVMSRLATGL